MNVQNPCRRFLLILLTALLLSTISSVFNISHAVIGDVNNDGALNLTDAIVTLQVMSGGNPDGVGANYGESGADVNNDSKVGFEETTYILQRIAGNRPGTLDEYIFFVGNNGTNGWEPWKTDGTADGTVMVKDINSGALGSGEDMGGFTQHDGAVYFMAYTPATGYELWKTDGTAEGTVMVKDINPGNGGSEPGPFVSFKELIYFNAYDGANWSLWQSDGTAGGTVPVDWLDGLTTAFGFTPIGDVMYFSGEDDTHGLELWKTDGTVQGTVMVKDILPITCEYGYMFPSYFVNVNGTLFFHASDAYCNSSRLWKSDGTEEGTVMVKDVSPGYEMVNIDGTLFFGASTSGYGTELWKSDGTEEGTVMVRDIQPSVNGSNGGSNPRNFTNVDGLLYFTATHYLTGTELWKSDGTWNGSVGTDIVKDIYPGPASGSTGSSSPGRLTNVNGTLFFTANDGVNGTELWKSHRQTGTFMVKDITLGVDGSQLDSFRSFNGKLLFRALDSFGREFWTSDATEAGTDIVKDVCPGPCWGFEGF